MVNNLLFLFFKLIRKIKYTIQDLYNFLKVAYYYQISKKRFRLKPSIILGKRFSINSDITSTSVVIGDNCRFRNNFNITIGNAGKLNIGNSCFFNNNCSINCLGTIEIGNNNQFGEGVLFYDHNHIYKNKNQLISDQGYNVGGIKIGNNCWIGSNVVILKNVEIGDNVVIGAGCVIYQSIPANSVVTNQQNLLIREID